MNRLSLLSGFALFSLPAAVWAGTPALSGKSSAPRASGGYWRVSAGYMHRSTGDVQWNTGSYSALSLLPIGPGSNTPGIEAIGPAGSYADRLYRNGFVFRDAGTEENGDTWYWGYDHGRQLSGDAVTFTGGNGTAATFHESSSYTDGRWHDTLDGNAPYLQLEWILPVSDSLSWGWQGGLSFLSSEVSRRLSTFSGERVRGDWAISYTDTYELDGSIVPLAPYSGSFAGPGILLRNLPSSRTDSAVLASSETVTAANDVHAAFDVNLYSLSLGPVVEFHRGPFFLSASAGLTVNIADWDATQTEDLNIRATTTVAGPPGVTSDSRHWRDTDSGTDVFPGFFMQAALSRELNQSWSISAFSRFDWTGTVEVATGPSTAEAGLTGWSAGAGLGYRF